jgi:hypothetical protein
MHALCDVLVKQDFLKVFCLNSQARRRRRSKCNNPKGKWVCGVY